jgi:hypothetical protein
MSEPAMTEDPPAETRTTSEPAPPAAAAEGRPEREEQSFLASFSRGDMKLLVVTFLGTVAANLVTVAVVGYSIILARNISGIPGGLKEGTELYGGAIAGLLVFGFLLDLIRRHQRSRFRVVLRRMSIGCLVLAGLYGLGLMLALLGAAAGVK